MTIILVPRTRIGRQAYIRKRREKMLEMKTRLAEATSEKAFWQHQSKLLDDERAKREAAEKEQRESMDKMQKSLDYLSRGPASQQGIRDEATGLIDKLGNLSEGDDPWDALVDDDDGNPNSP